MNDLARAYRFGLWRREDFPFTQTSGAMRSLDKTTAANGLGIAAAISGHRVQSSVPVCSGHHVPTAHCSSSGYRSISSGICHRDDPQILEDAELNYSKIIGSTIWESAGNAGDLGKEWIFLALQSYKPSRKAVSVTQRWVC
jgi:hypothetical protein